MAAEFRKKFQPFDFNLTQDEDEMEKRNPGSLQKMAAEFRKKFQPFDFNLTQDQDEMEKRNPGSLYPPRAVALPRSALVRKGNPPQLLESCQQRRINFYRDTAYRYRQNLQGSYCIVFSRCCFVDRVFFLDLFFTLLVFTCSFHTSQGIKERCRTSQCRLAEVRIDFSSRYSSPASAEPRLQRDTHG